jgi:hypothetical protein
MDHLSLLEHHHSSIVALTVDDFVTYNKTPSEPPNINIRSGVLLLVNRLPSPIATSITTAAYYVATLTRSTPHATILF